MGLVESLIVFAISFLVGAIGIYVGARIITDREDYSYAFVTALIGAIIWSIVAFFVGWIPLLGPVLALLAYVGVINWRYPGGWVNAAAISIVAWIAALVVIYALAAVGLTSFEAAGVPGI